LPLGGRTRWESYSVPPDPLAVIRGKGEKEREEKGWNRGRVWKVVKGYHVVNYDKTHGLP